ncbi:MAG: sigma-70 family RNA polymerase sigma factor [Actinomycetota bacterium]|nr:sigma-70 family RNA polymerase sigma factor [Actinomycetota bacterium]
MSGSAPSPRVVRDASVTEGTDRELERLYREHGARLFRALVAYTGDREVASDAVAEAFAQALGRGEEIRSALAWVWRASFRIAAGTLKERGRQDPLGKELSYEMPEPPRELIGALVELSPKQRAALILRFYVGYPTREVAEILGSSPATVRVHLSQGRRRLRKMLEDNDG